MATPWRSSRRVRFGDFVLDLSTRELFRNGARHTLAPQPFQVLELLIERRGELVPREELIRHLWHSNTFVDFDQGLKKAVNRLREVLNDSPERPRFVETLPRQGYRFVAELLPDFEVVELKPIPPTGPILVDEGPQSNDSSVSPYSLTRRRIVGLAIACLLIILLIVCFMFWHSPATVRATSIDALTNDGLPKGSLVSDGQRLYFVEAVNGESSVTEISVKGGDRNRINTPIRDPYIYDYSGPRSELLVGGEQREKHRELWAIPVPAGTIRRIGEVLVHDATWAPDGSHIVYTQNHGIWVCKYDGSEPRRLLVIDGYPHQVRFSVTGSFMRFTVQEPASSKLSIWEAQGDGTRAHQIVLGSGGFELCCGIWSSDGRHFFLTNWLINQRVAKEIWVSNLSTGLITSQWSRPAPITNGPIGFGTLTFGEGGNLYAIGTQPRAKLVRYDTRARRFVPFLGGISAMDADVSSDNEWVTYVSYPELSLWRSRLDGSDRQQLTFPPTEAFLPKWSPDGSQIVFTNLQPDNQSRIYIVSRNGGTAKAVLPSDSLNQIDPTWTPDASRIVFARTYLDANLAIYEADLGTGTVEKVPNSEKLTSPRLSADGRFIAALTQDWTTVMLYDRITRHWSVLLKMGAVGYPVWSHDSKNLFVRTSVHSVAKINVLKKQTQTVLRLEDFPEPGTSWMSLTPSDDLLLHRDETTQEIYRIGLEYR
jgi:DNA-binding winged helix-turn-helix (wHTH) protein/Tol biopolymer transport system component